MATSLAPLPPALFCPAARDSQPASSATADADNSRPDSPRKARREGFKLLLRAKSRKDMDLSFEIVSHCRKPRRDSAGAVDDSRGRRSGGVGCSQPVEHAFHDAIAAIARERKGIFDR